MSAIRRYPTCIEAWPECVPDEYNPACCRWPKSCSCEIKPHHLDQFPFTPPSAEGTPS